MGTTVSSILKHKGRDVVTVEPQQTVTWVVEVLAQNRIARGARERISLCADCLAEAAVFRKPVSTNLTQNCY
jgi:hypothetical protein